MNKSFEKIVKEFLDLKGETDFEKLKSALKYKLLTERDAFDKFDGLM